MLKEIWKDIKGYEGRFQVSNLGNVKSLDRYFTNRWGGQTFKKGKIISQRLDHKGYPRVTFSCGRNKITGKVNSFTYRTHRLVAETFIDNPENKPCVNHIDCNPKNNKLENLEWVTYSENQLHAEKLGRRDHVRKISSNRLKEMHKNKDKRLKNYA